MGTMPHSYGADLAALGRLRLSSRDIVRLMPANSTASRPITTSGRYWLHLRPGLDALLGRLDLGQLRTAAQVGVDQLLAPVEEVEGRAKMRPEPRVSSQAGTRWVPRSRSMTT